MGINFLIQRPFTATSLKKAFYSHYLLIGIVYSFVTLFFLNAYIPVWKIGNHIPLGDTPYQAWIMAWHNYSLFHHPFKLFDANILHPVVQPLSYMDGSFSASFTALPFYLFTSNAILVHNILTYLSFIIAALGTYIVLYHYLRCKPGAFIGGLIYAFCSHRLWRTFGHLSILQAHWIPLGLLFFHRLIKHPSLKNVLLFSLFYLLISLGQWYLLVINSLFLLFFFVLLVLFKEVRLSSKLIITLLVVVVINSLLILPFLYPYIKVYKQGGRYNVIDELAGHSADFDGYFLPPMHIGRNVTLLGRLLLSQGITRERLGENSQFVGYLPLLLALDELFFLLIFGVRTSRDKLSLIMILIFTVFLILSFGPFLFFNDKRVEGVNLPWYFVYKFLPPLRFMRAIGRFSVVAMFCLAWLAGSSVGRILAENKNNRLLKYLVCSFFPVIILMEYYNLEAIKPFEMHVPKTYNWLAKQPGDLGILELPTLDERYFIYSTQHWKKIMLGQYFPDNYHQDLLSLNNFNESCIFLLKKYKVDLMIIHGNKPLAENLRESPYFKELYSMDNSWTFELSQEGENFNLMKTVMGKRRELTGRPDIIKSLRLSKQDIGNNLECFSGLTLIDKKAGVFRTQDTLVSFDLPLKEPFPALQFKKIVLRMRARSPTDKFTTCSFYWTTQEEPKFSEKNRLKLKVILDNKFHIYELNLLDSFQWITSGEITKIHFHPVIGENIELEIDYLYFL